MPRSLLNFNLNTLLSRAKVFGESIFFAVSVIVAVLFFRMEVCHLNGAVSVSDACRLSFDQCHGLC